MMAAMMTAEAMMMAAVTRSAPDIAPAQATDDHGGDGPPGSPPARFSGLRVRILGGYVLVLTVATIASLFVLRTVLINRLDERINHSLAQEVAELQTLAKGSDPETGRPFKGTSGRSSTPSPA